METTADGLLALDQRRRSAATRLVDQNTQIATARSHASRMGARQIGKLNKQFSRSVPDFQAGWTSRGLRNSGFYRQAAQRFVGDQAETVGQVNEDLSTTLNDLALQSRGFQRDYDDELLRIREERAALIAQGANEIRRLRG